MRELDKISEELFDKIRARFDHVSIGDSSAKRITDAGQARFFNFDYVSEDGENFGNITISLIDENALKVYYSSNIAENLTEEQEKEWFDFLRNLKKFAKRNLMLFDVRDINRSNLDLKDIKQQTDNNGTFDKEELEITESRLYGMGNNKRVSFGDIGTHKIIIKHKNQIDPERHGSRGRQIEHVFIETPIGERFLLDHTNLHGARAIANHMRHGGRFGDEGSDLINEMVKEMSSMRHFVRSMRNRTFEDAETSGMVESAIFRYNEIKENLKKFQGRQGHELLMNTVGNYSNMDEEVDLDALRERFVKKIYDDRFNEALPYVYKAYKKQQKNENSFTNEFKSWADNITVEGEEGFDNEGDERAGIEFSDLVKTPILVGMDGVDAIAALKPLFNNDELNSALKKLSISQGPDADARRILAGWLTSQGESDLANIILQTLLAQNQPQQPQPVSPQPAAQSYGATTTDQPVVYEDIALIKWLSGLGKK